MKYIKDCLGEISDKVVIATTTLYKPDLRGDVCKAKLALDTIEVAIDLGYQIIVVDGGSPDEFLQESERYGANIFKQESPGMGNAKRQAIKEAQLTDKPIIALTDLEKEDYINQISLTAYPLLQGVADLVVPQRISLETYPIVQSLFEERGNELWKKLTGTDLDIWFGPRTFLSYMSDYFLVYNGEYGDLWDSFFIPVFNAILDGKKVIGVEVDYTHPEKQTNVEQGDIDFDRKRLRQYNNLSRALASHWRKLHPKPDLDNLSRKIWV